MSNLLCKCGTGMFNTGIANCSPTGKPIKKIIFVNLAQSSGTLNYINPGTTLNKAWFTALLNNPDTSQRFYLTPEFKNVDTPKSDPTFETYDDQSKFFIVEGYRMFNGVLADCPPLYKTYLESVRCNNGMGVYFIDTQNNVIGLTNNSDNYLYPIPFDSQSMVAKAVMGNYKQTTQLAVEFGIPTFVDDGSIRMISGNAFPDFLPLAQSGLQTVNATLVNVTDTTLTVNLTVTGAALDQPVPVLGMAAANFVSYSGGTTSKIWNSTDSAAETVTVATNPAVPGQYILTFASISGKTLILAALMNGYDFSNLPSLVIATP